MALKLLLPVFVLMLLWLLFPISAQWTSSTNTSCIRKILQGDCSVATVDNSTTCCTSIVSETQLSGVCMCSAFGKDANFVDGFTMYCGSSIGSILVFCPDASLLTSPPITNTPPPAPPAPLTTSNTSSPATPSNSTTPPSSNVVTGKKSNVTTIVIVVIVVILVVVIIVISIICIRRRKNKIKQNDPSNNDNEKSQKELESQNPHMSSSGGASQSSGSASQSFGGGASSQSSGGASLQQTPNSNADRGWNFTNVKKEEIKPNKVDFKLEWSEYDIDTLRKATDNFSEKNIIGKGGFGNVYKGTLQNGDEVAVKRLSKKSDQGDPEFKAEVERLAVLIHKNLIKLRGYCSEKGEELLLVYEFAVNKSLADHLFASEDIRKNLKWSNRFEIIKGIAVGLQHLHTGTTPATVHRDLKAGNVLLDEKMNPKIADFGLARKCDPDQTYGMTRRTMGSDGYIAPEYARNRERFSTKTDVYAFGVLVLEIISGKRVNSRTKYDPKEDGVDLVSYAWRCRDDKNLSLKDPLLENSVSIDEEVKKCTKLGLSCVQDKSNERPDMSKILEFLNYKAESADLPTPRCPEYLFFGGRDPTTTLSSEQSATDSSGTISSSDKSNFGNAR